MATLGARATGIFISYRRADTGWPARWLADLLEEHFGRDVVFQDVDSIRPGDDFAAAIEAAVGTCSAMLAVIGPRWLTAQGDSGRGLDDPQDWVRLEIEAAIRREIRIIPVLIDGAKMPTASELPPSLRGLARRQAVALSLVSLDTRRLVSALETVRARIGKGEEGPETQPPDLVQPGRSQASRLLVSAIHDSEAADRDPASAQTQQRDRSRRPLRRKDSGPLSGRPDRSQESRRWWDFNGRIVPLPRRRMDEGRSAAIRESCVALLRGVCDLRTSVAAISEYHGDELAARVASVRKSAAESQMRAFKVTLLAPSELADSAESLAVAANQLAEITVRYTDLSFGAMTRQPDFTDLDARTDAFVQIAMEQAKGTRVQREDYIAALQQASVELLGAVTELRTGVANMADYHGDEMGARLTAIRSRAADSQVHALNVALLTPRTLAQPAQALARAASRLTEDATRETDLGLGFMHQLPNFSKINALGDAFARAATDQAGSSYARREDHAVALQQASVELLRAVTELRTGVANMHDYRGYEMAVRLAGIRNLATDSQVYAANVALLAPGTLAEPAQALAAAASRFAEATVAQTDLDHGAMIGFPRFP